MSLLSCQPSTKYARLGKPRNTVLRSSNASVHQNKVKAKQESNHNDE
jgi:hypothetical protein